jgi:hypothetical protein
VLQVIFRPYRDNDVHTLIRQQYARGKIQDSDARHRQSHRYALVSQVRSSLCTDKLYAEDLSPAHAISVQPSPSPYRSPLQPLYPICFSLVDPLLPRALLQVFKGYEAEIERAKFQQEEPTEDDFLVCYRAMLVIVSEVKKGLLRRSEAEGPSSLGHSDGS